MDNNNNNPSAGSGQDGKFFSGFLLGLLIGAAVVFLLATKKGKKFLKVISEEGIDNISNILEEANNSQDPHDEAVEKTEEVAPKREIAFKTKTIEKPKVRRFFRGISRHVN